MLLKENRTADVIGSLISILTRAGHARMIGQLMLATSYPLSWFFLIVVPSKNKNVKELCVTRSNSYKKSLTVAILPLAFPGALCTGIYSGMLWSQDTRKPIDSFQIRIRRLAYFPCATLQDEFQFPETFHLKSDFHLSLSLSVVLFRTRLSRSVSSLSRATNSLYGAFIRRSLWPWHIHEWNKAPCLTSNRKSKGKPRVSNE